MIMYKYSLKIYDLSREWKIVIMTKNNLSISRLIEDHHNDNE